MQIIQGRPGRQTMDQIIGQNQVFLSKTRDAKFDEVPLPPILPGFEYSSSQLQMIQRPNRIRF